MAMNEFEQQRETLTRDLASVRAWRQFELESTLPERSDPSDIIRIANLVYEDQRAFIQQLAEGPSVSAVSRIVRSSLIRAGQAATSAREDAESLLARHDDSGRSSRVDVRGAYDQLRSSVESLLTATQILDSLESSESPTVEASAWVETVAPRISVGHDNSVPVRPDQESLGPETNESIRTDTAEVESRLPTPPQQRPAPETGPAEPDEATDDSTNGHIAQVTSSDVESEQVTIGMASPAVPPQSLRQPVAPGAPSRFQKIAQNSNDVRLERRLIVESQRERRRQNAAAGMPGPGVVRRNLDFIAAIALLAIVVAGLWLLLAV